MKNKSDFRKKIVENLGALGIVLALGGFASAQLINEIDINPPSTDQPCEYIEIIGTPGATVGANTYYVEVDGDATAAGRVNMVVNLSGLIYGTNGLITIAASDACGTRNYSVGGSTVITDAQLNAGGIQNGTSTFLIITSVTSISEGTDYDSDNDGVLEGALASATIIDGIAVFDGDTGDDTYAPVLTNSTGISAPPDALTRFSGNTTANSANSFFYGDLTGATNDTTTYSTTARSTNFPSNGSLTPGTVNTTTAAPATISGRVSSGSQGIPRITVMLSGGDLEEPIYTTTNNFGRYSFKDLTVGETYVVQIFGKKYNFTNTSIVVSLQGDFTNADFTAESK
jgi:hypothetical protein